MWPDCGCAGAGLAGVNDLRKGGVRRSNDLGNRCPNLPSLAKYFTSAQSYWYCSNLYCAKPPTACAIRRALTRARLNTTIHKHSTRLCGNGNNKQTTTTSGTVLSTGFGRARAGRGCSQADRQRAAFAEPSDSEQRSRLAGQLLVLADGECLAVDARLAAPADRMEIASRRADAISAAFARSRTISAPHPFIRLSYLRRHTRRWTASRSGKNLRPQSSHGMSSVAAAYMSA